MRLHDYLEYWASIQPEAECVVFDGRRMSYASARSSMRRMATSLIGSGVEVGERIGVVSKNRPELLLLYYAASAAGAVPVPLNYRLTPADWVYIVNDAEATVLFVEEEYVEAVEAVRDQLPKVREFIAIGGDAAAIGGDGRPGWTAYNEWAAQGRDMLISRAISEGDDLYQMYTSGTTGRPKGAVLTHRAVMSHLEQVSPFFRFSEGERGLGVAPMYHAAGCLLAFRAIADGGSVYLMAEFDPLEVVRVLDEERIVKAIMVPAMIQACLVSTPSAWARHYPDLRMIYYGSSPISASTLRRAVTVFKCRFNQAYGMTELTAGSTNLSAEDHRRALSDRPELLLSAGRPLMGVEIQIVDEDDRPVPSGNVGEILMRGPQMMRGYWNMPDETSEAMRGGWMHTGDTGRFDYEGYLYVIDRLKDMIVSGGENVSPRAVEDVLFEHPSIVDAAVIGVPDDRWGETVKAIVVRRDGSSVSEAEVLDYCRDRLAGFQRPRSVEFRDALPHAANGKLLKRVLREPYWEGRDRRVGGS